MGIALTRRPWLAALLLIAPAVITIAFFMLAPLGLMGVVSFLEKGVNGGVRWGSYTVEPYVQFLFERDLDDSLVLNSDYVQIFWRSIWLSVITTILALAIGFPTALYMALQPPSRRNLLVFLVTIPFWTNLLVRNYSWILLLRTNGLVNNLLIWLGIVDGPLVMMPSSFAIAVGLTYSFLPFMVLPIYASLEKLDFRLIEAAYDLGAGRWTALKRIIVPLSLPGIVAGSVLVFIPCLGAFVTPELLGGGKSLMLVLVTLMLYLMRFGRRLEAR
jgi:spermidine/putrescine transport system permease protein